MSNQSHREIAAPDVATPKLTGSIRKGKNWMRSIHTAL